MFYTVRIGFFYKGVHTAMLKSYMAFDLETTGLDPQENEIIEI